jgi:hypothetical protein
MRRPPINLSPTERVVRVAVGIVGVVAGSILLGSTGGTAAVVLLVLLVLAGLDLAVTGALGFCPLYKQLGRPPRSLGKATR